PDVIAGEHPDLIVFTGDAINSPGGLPVFKGCLTRIAKVAPTFAVRGNCDTWFWSGLDLFGDTAAQELGGEALGVEVRGTPLWVAGVPVGREGRIGEILRGMPRSEFRLFLYHYPDEVEHVAALGAYLYCAGHTHGGQLALPLYGALVTLSR